MSTVRDIQDAFNIAQISSFLSYQEEETKSDIFFSLHEASVLQLFTRYISNEKTKTVSTRVKQKLDRCLGSQEALMRAFTSKKSLFEHRICNFGITAPFVKVLQFAENADSFYAASSGVKRGLENACVSAKYKTQRLTQREPFNNIQDNEESDRFLSFPNGDKLSSNSLDDDADETSIDTTCEEPELCHRQESGGLITEHDEFAPSVEQKVDIIEEESSRQSPFLQKYLGVVTKLSSSKALLLQQRGRHLEVKARWNCFDDSLLKEIGITQTNAVGHFASEKKFGINTSSLESLWREDGAYKKMFRKLSNLVDDGLIESQDSVDEAVVELNDTVNLKTGLVFSSLTAVLSYVPVPLSSATSESHCKIELWAPIFSAAFKINQSRMNSVWELLHPIPGNGGMGSLVSDFSAIVQGPLAIPAFMVEFQVGRTGTHKDDVCLISEAAFEYHQYLSQINILSSDLKEIRFHIGYVSDGRIEIDEIHPEYHAESKLVYYRVFSNIANFDLLKGDSDSQIYQTLQLLKFIKTVLVPNGNVLHKFMTSKTLGLSTLSEFLPILPKKGVKASERKGLFTPQKKL